MLLWDKPDDGLGFEELLKLEDDREPIAATSAARYRRVAYTMLTLDSGAVVLEHSEAGEPWRAE